MPTPAVGGHRVGGDMGLAPQRLQHREPGRRDARPVRAEDFGKVIHHHHPTPVSGMCQFLE